MNRLFLALFALMLAIPLAGCQSRGVASSDTLKIGAYSVVREVIHDGLIPAFAARWKRKTGREVQFEESYDASGAQARTIATGFDADIAVLSHSGDMEVLVKDGRVKSDWNSGPHGALSATVWSSLATGRAIPSRSRTGPTWPGPAWACSTPTRRPPAAPAGTSTQSTGRLCWRD